MRPSGWGLCVECERKPLTGPCPVRGACYFGEGRSDAAGLWLARHRDAVAAQVAYEGVAPLTVDGGTITLTDSDGKALRLKFSPGDFTIGECVMGPVRSFGRATFDALAHGQRSIDEARKRIEECGSPATCGDCWAFHKPGLITSYCEWAGEGHEVNYDGCGRYCKGRAFAPRKP